MSISQKQDKLELLSQSKSDILLACLWKAHSSEWRGQSLRVHFTTGTLQVIVLPSLRVGGLQTSGTYAEASAVLVTGLQTLWYLLMYVWTHESLI